MREANAVSLPYAYQPKTRIVAVDIFIFSSRSSACGNCGKVAQTVDSPAFGALDKLWNKARNIHIPVEKTSFPYIFALAPPDSCLRPMHKLHIFCRLRFILAPKSVSNRKISTNPHPVDKFRCGKRKPPKTTVSRLLVKPSPPIIHRFSPKSCTIFYDAYAKTRCPQRAGMRSQVIKNGSSSSTPLPGSRCHAGRVCFLVAGWWCYYGRVLCGWVSCFGGIRDSAKGACG